MEQKKIIQIYNSRKYSRNKQKELESKDWMGILSLQNVEWSLSRHILEYLLDITDNKTMFSLNRQMTMICVCCRKYCQTGWGVFNFEENEVICYKTNKKRKQNPRIFCPEKKKMCKIGVKRKTYINRQKLMYHRFHVSFQRKYWKIHFKNW